METDTNLSEKYNFEREILNFDGYVVCVSYGENYMLTNIQYITNPEEVAEGKNLYFNMDDEDNFIDEATVGV